MKTLSDIVKEKIPFFGNGQVNNLDGTQFSASNVPKIITNVFNDILTEENLDLSFNSLSDVLENSGKTPVIYTGNDSKSYKQTLLSPSNDDIPLGVMLNGAFNKMLYDSNPDVVRLINKKFYWEYYSDLHLKKTKGELFNFHFALFRFKEGFNPEDIFKKSGFSINKYKEKRNKYSDYLKSFMDYLKENINGIEKRIGQTINWDHFNLYYIHNLRNHFEPYWGYFVPSKDTLESLS